MDKKLISQKEISRLKIIYAVALSIIAFTMVITSLIMWITINKNKGDSRVINLSGRQRMLSQRITKDVLAISFLNSIDEKNYYHIELEKSFLDWKKAHLGLQNGDKDLGLPSKINSKDTQLLFFEIEVYYKNIKENIELLLKIMEQEKDLNKINLESAIISKKILENEKYFLPLMDKITFQFDYEANQKIKSMGKIEALILIVGLSMLLFEFLFVFRPSLRNLTYTMKELITINKNLITSESRLIEANKTKEMMISVISHDLRGPLGNISNVIEYIVEKNILKDDEKELFEGLKNNTKNSYKLLLNLLLWVKSNKEEVKVDLKSISIKSLIMEIVELYEDIANKKQITLENNFEKDIMINSENFMLSTILRNFISNAIKFTPKMGKVKIEILEKESEIIISVIDTGTGIEKDSIKKLFKLNENISTRGTEGELGTGMGLVLCNEFATKLNGKILVESEEGKGSKFSLVLKK